MEKEGFFGDGRARGVARQARRRQMTLLEGARSQTVPHAPGREFQCRTGDRCVVKYFPLRLPSKGRLERHSCWCAHWPKWRSLENLAGKSC